MSNQTDNSTVLDTTLFTDTDEFKQAGIFLENEFKTQGLIKNKSIKRKKHLQLILANLLDAHRRGRDAVSYSRNRNEYTPTPYRRKDWKECSERYSPFGASYDSLIRAIDCLSELDLIGGRKGYQVSYFGNDRTSSWSRMYATDKLLNLIEDKLNIDLDTIGYSLDNEAVILKDGDKKYMDYEDTPEIISMRDNLRGLNQLLSETELGLKDYSTEIEEDHHDSLNRPDNKFMYRVFNDESFEKGGRFYGGYWVSGLDKYLRENIRINDLETVYWDFDTMSQNLFYAHTGLPDEYKNSLRFKDKGESPRESEITEKRHKKLFQFALNTDSIEEWVKAAKGEYSAKKYPQKRHISYEKFIESCPKQGPITDEELKDFLYKYQDLPKGYFFNKSLGLELMYTESRITEKIIMTFIDQSIPVLPIHDGFICTKEYEDLLKRTMVSAYESVTGFKPSGIHKEH